MELFFGPDENPHLPKHEGEMLAICPTTNLGSMGNPSGESETHGESVMILLIEHLPLREREKKPRGEREEVKLRGGDFGLGDGGDGTVAKTESPR